MTRRACLTFTGLILQTAGIGAQVASQPAAPLVPPGQRWCFIMKTVATDAGRDATLAVIKHARQAGYNGVVLSDSKLDKFQLQNEVYCANLALVRQACRDEQMLFIPCVAPFGYSEGILSNDPNLAEGMPVREATFVVKDGKLAPFDDTTVLRNGNLEQWKGNVPAGWTVDEPGKISFRDETARAGKSCLRQEDVAAGDKHNRGRLYQRITVKPWHYYHASVWVKTENCTSKDWRFFAFDESKNMPLNWQGPAERIKPTQDWTQYHVTFSTIDNSNVVLYAGCWNGKKGKVWFDDIRIEPAGFVNIIRRDSEPLRLTSPDGKTAYVEGEDFAIVRDPLLGNDPGPGHFSNWHTQPVIAIPAGSRLKEGDQVLASYHFASTCGKPNNINMCMSEPKTYEIVEQQIRWVKEHAQPDAYMLSHDEIRMNGWDDACTRTGKSNGQILADNLRHCAEIVRRVDPGKPIVVWNDMFDPFQNAKEMEPDGRPHIMYMAKGGWAGSWEGLAPDICIANWFQNEVPSVRFFDGRGNRQILMGYYDDAANIAKNAAWLTDTADCTGIVGTAYTTWTQDYTQLEAYAAKMKDAGTRRSNAK